MLYRAFVEIESDYSSSGFFPHIPGCIFACSDPKEAIEKAALAVHAHFELMAEKGMKIPAPPEDVSVTLPQVNFDSAILKTTAWFDLDIDTTKYVFKK
ncbi:type II toxin-antitoxin system HicB family antitoxin [Pantoea ananatis]|uniref:type II toxin-antitoxin system HicB family antitoxin n=1 Tax=Pantoea ananas TaxID=553 RepID=UPI0024AD46BE|nr:type II toxin-antitoxin system HicB family antitoxin [Pantoea ananatis]MDI6539584.1 type II toxin-antitoxin system HicB family antitoxin [Pantoea ananatis]